MWGYEMVPPGAAALGAWGPGRKVQEVLQGERYPLVVIWEL